MDHNLIQSYTILVKVRLCYKNHNFGSEEAGIRVPFKLSGILSVFDLRAPTDDDFI